jgi:hypothetical protein
MTGPRNDGSTTVQGSVTGTGIAIGAGARAQVTTDGAAGPVADLATAVQGLRAQLAALDAADDETAERAALADSRLKRLEEAARAPEKDHSRIRRLFEGVIEAVSGLATLAGGVAALQAAVTALLR